MSEANTQLAHRTTGNDVAPSPAAMSFADMQQLAVSVAKSGLFACRTPEQALTLMMIAQAEGIHPIQACREFDVIEGRPSMKASAMQARFLARGGKITWIERTDTACEAEFAAPGSTRPLRVRWTIEQAQKAGLVKKSVWIQYPRNMLSARVISEGVRAVMPGVVLGIYAADEAADANLIDVPVVTVGTPTEALTPTPQPTTAEKPKPASSGPSERFKKAMDALTRNGFGDIEAERIIGAAQRKHGASIDDLDEDTFGDWYLGFASMKPKPATEPKSGPSGGRFVPDVPPPPAEAIDPETGELFQPDLKPAESATAFSH